MRLWYGSLAICLMCSLCGPIDALAAKDLPSNSEELFRDGDTIVFFGDSITQAGMYVDHFEAWLLCRYSDRRFQVLDRGINSETISGTSETDHQPRRPWAHERFSRDIVPLKPQVLIACFGMNDGNYHPFEWRRFEQYQQGIRRLIERAHQEAGVRTVILLTPPPFDPYRRKPLDPEAKEFGYKFPAVDYDQTLRRYSSWLTSLRDEGRFVVDLHSTLNRYMRERRQDQVSFTLIPDSIHPDMTGHWLMATEMVRQLQLAPAPLVTAWNEEIPTSGWQGIVKLAGFAPVEATVDSRTLQMETARSSPFAWQWLRWNRIDQEGRWELQIDETVIGEFDGKDLAIGISIPAHPELTIFQRRSVLYAMVRERRQLEYWQFRAGTDKPLNGKTPAENIPGRIAVLTAEIESLRQPVESTIRLRKRSPN